jgi:hypothetical protein
VAVAVVDAEVAAATAAVGASAPLPISG